MISEDDVKKLARLARLGASDDQIRVFAQQLNGILEYVARLDKVSTDGVEAMSHVHGVTNILRPDEVIQKALSSEPAFESDEVPRQGMLPVDDMLKNAPDSTGRFIKVPLIVE